MNKIRYHLEQSMKQICICNFSTSNLKKISILYFRVASIRLKMHNMMVIPIQVTLPS